MTPQAIREDNIQAGSAVDKKSTIDRISPLELREKSVNDTLKITNI